MEESSTVGPHWFSYTETTLGFSSVCAISVVLDAGAQGHFSGIRVIVVRKGRSDIDRVVLKNCLMMSRWNELLKSSKLIYATCREAMTDYKRSQALSQRLIKDSPRLPLCTIVFELQDTGNDRNPSVSLTMRTDSISDGPLRIIYDHATPGHTLFVFLESNHFFRNTITPSMAYHTFCRSFEKHRRCDTHDIRVLPASGPRKPFPHLPSDVVRRIAEKAFRYRNMGWRASLLSYVLVCKSWYPLINMFYETLGSPFDRTKLNPRAVSNTLERQPAKGRLIRRVKYQNFKPTLGDSGHMDFSEALISVLRLSVFVKEVKLGRFPSILVPDLLDTLRLLERVKILEMHTEGDDCSIDGGTHNPNIIDMQRSIANWTELRVLKLGSWDESGEMQSVCQIPSKSRLKNLLLEDGSLTGTQLLWFASPYSKIQDLSLNNIRGLSNSGLSAILHEISPTLRDLAIIHSIISREGVNEPYALDNAMPKMTSLRTANIHGDLLTSLSISTKPEILDSASPTFISIYLAPHDAEGLIKAFETTGWDAIDLKSNNVVAWDNDTQERAYQTAQDKGIRFRCWVNDGIQH